MDQYLFPFSNLRDSDLFLLINDNPVHSFPLLVIDNMTYKSFKYYDCDNATNNLNIEYNKFEPICKYKHINLTTQGLQVSILSTLIPETQEQVTQR